MTGNYKKILLIQTLIIAILFSIGTAFAADSPLELNTSSKKEPRNNWGLSFNYTESGFGLSSSYFIPVWEDTDLFFNLLITGVSDDREIERYDIFGNSEIIGKENRIFMIPLSIGLQKYMFKDDLEGNFKPIISAGITPTLVLTNPADKGFLEAMGYFKSSFAFGGFVGIGMEYVQLDNMSFAFSARYYYLPVIGREINSLENEPIKNVGGLQLVFGVNFLR